MGREIVEQAHRAACQHRLAAERAGHAAAAVERPFRAHHHDAGAGEVNGEAAVVAPEVVLHADAVGEHDRRPRPRATRAARRAPTGCRAAPPPCSAGAATGCGSHLFWIARDTVAAGAGSGGVNAAPGQARRAPWRRWTSAASGMSQPNGARRAARRSGRSVARAAISAWAAVTRRSSSGGERGGRRLGRRRTARPPTPPRRRGSRPRARQPIERDGELATARSEPRHRRDHGVGRAIGGERDRPQPRQREIEARERGHDQPVVARPQHQLGERGTQEGAEVHGEAPPRRFGCVRLGRSARIEYRPRSRCRGSCAAGASATGA